MPSMRVLLNGPIKVVDYCCTSGPEDPSFVELHDSYSISFVRKGSFGYRYRGKHHELTAGSILLGRPNEEFLCTHEHHQCGDECLSMHLSAEAFDRLGIDDHKIQRACAMGHLPPMPSVAVFGSLSQASANGHSTIALDEAASLLVEHVLQTLDGTAETSCSARAEDRRRAVQAALWIDSHYSYDIDLVAIAQQTGLSTFHFLRVFSQVVGVTPHQYLLRSRLRHAAELLATDSSGVTEIALESGFNDLSNFVRTFHRAAGVSPRRFREMSKGKRELIAARFSKFEA